MRIGRYEVIDEIGAGGMGRVRLARDGGGRLVVLKNALRDDIDDDERLRDEGRVGLRLKHPSLVETLDLFEAKDAHGRSRPFLVTAYVPGVSLIELRRLGPLPPLVICRIARQIADALDVLHDARGDDGQPLHVLHRDVTAANCLVGHDGRARLIDLGISRSAESQAMRTGTGLLRGTLRYLAPELFDGGAYSVQSDIWALGVVMWEALIGRPAVSGSDAVAVGRICSGNIMNVIDGEEIEPRLQRAFAQLLRKEPRDRPRRAREAAALFAMLEKDLRGAVVDKDVDKAVQEVVWRASGGEASVDENAQHQQAARAFGSEDVWEGSTGPFPLLPPQPPTAVDAPASTTGTWSPAKTPSQSIADYAASLLSMEKALAKAWERSSAVVSETIATLPVVTGRAVEDDAADATDDNGEFGFRRAPALPEFPFSGFPEPRSPQPPTVPFVRRPPPIPNDEDGR